MSDMAEVLGDLWDNANATGLDGWIGPGRGAGEVDDYAIQTRERDIAKAAAALSAAGFGPVKEAKAEAWDEAAERFKARSDTLHNTMQEMTASKEYGLEDIVRYGAYSAEANTTATWLRTQAAKTRSDS